MSHPFFASFSKTLIINLERRDDRRREMAAELASLGTQVGQDNITLFPAVAPDDPGAFPSIGARGCFMSHLGLLKQALDDDLETLLILEDDATPNERFHQQLEAVLDGLSNDDWDIFYAGYHLDESLQPEGALTSIRPDMRVQTTHAMAIKRPAIASIVSYFEAMLARPQGSPEGGPMHVDGAYSWFRREHPDIRTVLATPEIMKQRASHSDISPVSWKDTFPFVGFVRNLKNRYVK